MGIFPDGRRNQFWFGTEKYMGWVPTPNSGADVSPQAWGVDGTTLNGGGYSFSSWDSHRQYNFEWSGASSKAIAQMMHSYANGTFGRGLIYFLDPLIYDTNVLPARWADPSITLGDEGPSLVTGATVSSVPTSNFQQNMLPVVTTTYDLGSVAAGYRGTSESVFIPIPDGFTLYLGAFYSATGTGGVYVTAVDANGNNGATTKLTALGNAATSLAADAFTGGSGVRLWIGRSTAVASTVSLAAISGRISTSAGAVAASPWAGGQGNSGCRFVGKPTYINNTGVNGGQVQYAATFREVGSWLS